FALFCELHSRLIACAGLSCSGQGAGLPPLVSADAYNDQNCDREGVDAIPVPELRQLLTAHLALELAQNWVAVVSHSRFGPPDAKSLDTNAYPGAVHIAQRTFRANATACRQRPLKRNFAVSAPCCDVFPADLRPRQSGDGEPLIPAGE